MKLVKIIPESFQEYEDHLSIVLFCYGCNFKCSYCYNYNFISDKTNILNITPFEAIDKHITPLSSGLVLLGGEPTLYKNLLDIADYAKSKHKLDTKLFTNGSNPDIVLEGLTSGKLDAVSIDFKVLMNDRLIGFGLTKLDTKMYRIKMLKLLNNIKKLGLEKRVQVRTTQPSGLSNSEVGLIYNVCNNLGIEHITQEDVSGHYRKLHLLRESDEISNNATN